LAGKPDILVHEIARPGGDFFGQTSAVDVAGDRAMSVHRV